MRAVKSLVGSSLVLLASLIDAVEFTPPHFNAATASEPENPWAFYNVTFFAANEGYGASYIRFNVQNNDASSAFGDNYSTFCSANAYPEDPINGGSTPIQFTTGGVQGGCDNINATWTWDGSTLETVYHYGSGE